MLKASIRSINGTHWRNLLWWLRGLLVFIIVLTFDDWRRVFWHARIWSIRDRVNDLNFCLGLLAIVLLVVISWNYLCKLKRYPLLMLALRIGYLIFAFWQILLPSRLMGSSIAGSRGTYLIFCIWVLLNFILLIWFWWPLIKKLEQIEERY